MSRSAEALNLELVTSILQLSRSMYIVFIENICSYTVIIVGRLLELHKLE